MKIMDLYDTVEYGKDITKCKWLLKVLPISEGKEKTLSFKLIDRTHSSEMIRETQEGTGENSFYILLDDKMVKNIIKIPISCIDKVTYSPNVYDENVNVSVTKVKNDMYIKYNKLIMITDNMQVDNPEVAYIYTYFDANSGMVNFVVDTKMEIDRSNFTSIYFSNRIDVNSITNINFEYPEMESPKHFAGNFTFHQSWSRETFEIFGHDSTWMRIHEDMSDVGTARLAYRTNNINTFTSNKVFSDPDTIVDILLIKHDKTEELIRSVKIPTEYTPLLSYGSYINISDESAIKSGSPVLLLFMDCYMDKYGKLAHPEPIVNETPIDNTGGITSEENTNTTVDTGTTTPTEGTGTGETGDSGTTAGDNTGTGGVSENGESNTVTTPGSNETDSGTTTGVGDTNTTDTETTGTTTTGTEGNTTSSTDTNGVTTGSNETTTPTTESGDGTVVDSTGGGTDTGGESTSTTDTGVDTGLQADNTSTTTESENAVSDGSSSTATSGSEEVLSTESSSTETSTPTETTETTINQPV